MGECYMHVSRFAIAESPGAGHDARDQAQGCFPYL